MKRVCFFFIILALTFRHKIFHKKSGAPWALMHLTFQHKEFPKKGVPFGLLSRLVFILDS
jgi:hypothetical protein